jgi:hypothetical protein
MNSTDTKSFVNTLPQEINKDEAEKKLISNNLNKTKLDPNKHMMAGAVAIAESNIRLNPYLLNGNELLPA